MKVTITMDDSVGPQLVKAIADLIEISDTASADLKKQREEEALKNHPKLPFITEL
jgi:hypothetical protein